MKFAKLRRFLKNGQVLELFIVSIFRITSNLLITRKLLNILSVQMISKK